MHCSLQDADLACIATQQYHVDYGWSMVFDRLMGLLPTYIPDNAISGSKTIERWAQLVMQEHKNVSILI